MFDRICLVHYHEVGLKGRNRGAFEHRLSTNMKAALSSYAVRDVSRISGHLLVVMDDASQLDDAAAALAQVPGVARVSIGWKCAREPDEYFKAAELALNDCGHYETFKVDAHRSNTDFPLDSMELNRQVGAHLCECAPDKKVKMKDPDVKVRVLVVQGSVYVYSRSMRGVGGLPVGSAGKVVSLLSSGIDSPVASWRMAKRGAAVVGIHFSGRPATSDASEHLVDDIAQALRPVGGIARVYFIPFGTYQRAIADECPPKLRIVLYRRLMFRIACKLARIEGAKALVTGESLGQVASQTLENIAAIDSVADLPVLRPLIGADKLEIIERAQKIGTFEISSRPADDCCTLFMPKSPETHARIVDCERAEEALSIATWVDEATSVPIYRDYPCASYRAPKSLPRHCDVEGKLR